MKTKINFEKTVYKSNQAYDSLDEEFTELNIIKYNENDIFRIYENLFYEIPKEKTETHGISHRMIVEEGTKYVGVITDPKELELKDLKEQYQNTQEEIDSIEEEHPYFRNNMILASKENLEEKYIMQSGKKRRIKNTSTFNALKSKFGGRGQGDEEFCVLVSQEAINNIPSSFDIVEENDLHIGTLRVNRYIYTKPVDPVEENPNTFYG